MRKHLYLIVDHEKPDRVGGVSIYDPWFTRSERNTTEPITIYDDEIGGFQKVGERVYLGYHDFDDEDDYEENGADEMQQNLCEIDDSHLEHAGLSEEVLA